MSTSLIDLFQNSVRHYPENTLMMEKRGDVWESVTYRSAFEIVAEIAAGLMEGEHQGFAWHDGDFFKWMEASVYIYALNKDEKILEEIDEILV